MVGEEKYEHDKAFLGRVNEFLSGHGVSLNLTPSPSYVGDDFDYEDGVLGDDPICLMGCGSRGTLIYDPTVKSLRLNIQESPGSLQGDLEGAREELREKLGLEGDVDIEISFERK